MWIATYLSRGRSFCTIKALGESWRAFHPGWRKSLCGPQCRATRARRFGRGITCVLTICDPGTRSPSSFQSLKQHPGTPRIPRPRRKPHTPVISGAAPWWTSRQDRKSTRLNSSHLVISYAVFCLKKKKKKNKTYITHNNVYTVT